MYLGSRIWALLLVAHAAAGCRRAPVTKPDARPDTAQEATKEGAATTPRLVGRFDLAKTPRFAWSGSTIAARFTGATSIAMRLRVAKLETSTAYTIELDDRPPVTVAVSHERERYELATGLDPKASHDIRIVREAEAFGGVHELLGLDLGEGGALLVPHARAHRIEFVGDSIMCGYGVLGKDASCPFSFATERATLAYPALVSRALGVDPTTLCWSGRGVHRNYDGSRADLMPELYERTLPAPPAAPFPFTLDAAPPRVVVIGLGTNDFLGGGGKPLDVPAFEDSYVRFLRRVRELRGNAAIVIATSPMIGPPLRDALKGALERVVTKRKSEGEDRLELVDLEFEGSRVGCDGHPNVEMHRILSQALEPVLRRHL